MTLQMRRPDVKFWKDYYSDTKGSSAPLDVVGSGYSMTKNTPSNRKMMVNRAASRVKRQIATSGGIKKRSSKKRKSKRKKTKTSIKRKRVVRRKRKIGKKTKGGKRRDKLT